MTARIARGSAAKAKPKGGRAPARGRSSRKRAEPSLLDSLPVAAETVRRVSWWILIAMIVAVVLAVAVALQVPQMIGTRIGEAIGNAGFSVRKIEIKGLHHMQRLPIYDIALDQDSMAMPLIDLEATRERLLRFGWIEEARVTRRWPDTLVVDIVERKPAAIWQNDGKLTLIDHNGVQLEPVKLEAMPDLPLIIGPNANKQADSLVRLLAAAPELKPMLAGATWVGGRRWDLRFQSGEVLALPEGQSEAQKALVRFARMDKMTPLLGHGFVRFDMRIPDKFVVRVSRVPGSSVPELAPPPTNQPLPPTSETI